jgi:tripartite-type tricarboxylate transporter receptor subunit TctC
MTHRRTLAGALLALAAGAACFGAAAQDPSTSSGQGTYPNKPVRMVVPYSPGAITDLAARVLAERLSVVLGQQVVIDNRAGAGTRIGMQAVASAPADGYTLLFANSVTHGTMPAMSKSALAFDPVKDFAPVGRAFTYTSILVCNQGTPVNTVPELVAYAKQNPDKLTNATAGPGTGHDLMGGLFTSLTGARMLHVHYKGAGPALQDVLAGTSNCIYGGGDVKQYVQSGKLKPLAVSGTRRDPDFPNVPTMEEAGVKGFNVTWWQGVVAPAGTPAPVIARLNAAVQEALKSPELQAKARGLTLVTAPSTPEQMGTLMREEIAKYQKIVKDANIPLQD